MYGTYTVFVRASIFSLMISYFHFSSSSSSSSSASATAVPAAADKESVFTTECTDAYHRTTLKVTSEHRKIVLDRSLARSLARSFSSDCSRSFEATSANVDEFLIANASDTYAQVIGHPQGVTAFSLWLSSGLHSSLILASTGRSLPRVCCGLTVLLVDAQAAM